MLNLYAKGLDSGLTLKLITFLCVYNLVQWKTTSFIHHKITMIFCASQRDYLSCLSTHPGFPNNIFVWQNVIYMIGPPVHNSFCLHVDLELISGRHHVQVISEMQCRLLSSSHVTAEACADWLAGRSLVLSLGSSLRQFPCLATRRLLSTSRSPNRCLLSEKVQRGVGHVLHTQAGC